MQYLGRTFAKKKLTVNMATLTAVHQDRREEVINRSLSWALGTVSLSTKGRHDSSHRRDTPQLSYSQQGNNRIVTES